MTIASRRSPARSRDITTAVTARAPLESKATLIPYGVHVTMTRDYGRTATEKANKLIQKLVFATGSVMLLVLFALGRREAMVVGARWC